MQSHEESAGNGRSRKTKRSGSSKRAGNTSQSQKSNGHNGHSHGNGNGNGNENGGQKLSDKDLAYFRDLLLTKRQELVGDINSMSREALQFDTATLSHYADDWADVGSDSQEQEFTLGLVESEHKLLEEISAALKRIQDGSYGICEATGKPITKARLKIKPWARYCIEAAREMENGGRGGS
jgi:DnaK suppressor protein